MTPWIARLCLIGVTCLLAVAQPPPGPRPPSVELGEFGGAHLEKIFAPLEHQIALPRSQLAQLRQSLTDRRVTAPENEKPVYQAALLVCNALSQAMDEREKAIASFQSSAAVHGSFDLGAHRKDRPSRKELRRERHEEEKRKEEAAQKDNFLSAQLKSSWQQRTIQLRQNIDRLYGRVRELERQAQPQAPAARETITLDKAIQVKVKYGTATIPAGTTLPVVSRDAHSVVVDYLGERVTLPQ
jgi:hypothetical protein